MLAEIDWESLETSIASTFAGGRLYRAESVTRDPSGTLTPSGPPSLTGSPV